MAAAMTSPKPHRPADVERKAEQELDRLEHRLLGAIGKASVDFGMLEEGDRVMVAVSGGKDSHAMLALLREVERRAPFSFSIIAVNLDQGHPGYPAELLPNYFESEGYDYRIISEDTYSIVKEKIPEGKTYCSLCSRLRRGVLYNTAVELGCTKIALGHHRDDAIQTLMLNLLYSGQIASMPPKLYSDDGRNTVIRPLAYCTEAEIARYAELKAFPIVPCDLCGSQDQLKRQRVKALIAELAEENSNIPGNLFAALSRVRPTQLYDRELLAKLGDSVQKESEQFKPVLPTFEAPKPALAQSDINIPGAGRRLPIFQS